MNRLHLTTLVLLFACPGAHAQSYSFRTFGEQEGWNSAYVNSLEQDPFGYLLIGTSEGLFRYDGFVFSPVHHPDTLSSAFIECGAQLDAHTILYGYNDGLVTQYSGGELKPLPSREHFRSRITDIAPDPAGTTWISSQNDGLLALEANGTMVHHRQELESLNIYSIAPVRKDLLLLGTDAGLIVWQLQGNTALVQYPDAFPITAVTDILPLPNNGWLVATEDAGLYHLSSADPLQWQPVGAGDSDLSLHSFRELRAHDGFIWASTNNHGLLRLHLDASGSIDRITEMHSTTGKSPRSVRLTFHDREGDLWIGAIGDGLLKLESNYFSMYSILTGEDPGVYAVRAAGDSLWIGGTGELRVLRDEQVSPQTWYTARNGLPAARITGIAPDSSGALYVATYDAGLWKKPANSSTFRRVRFSGDQLHKHINGIELVNGTVYLATDFGVYLLRKDKLHLHLTIENGLTSNVIRGLYSDSRGRMWFATTTGELTCMQGEEVLAVATPLPGTSFPVRCFAEAPDGTLWVGTEGAGVMSLHATTPVSFLKKDGLHSDFCYSLAFDESGRLWIGQRGAASRVNLTTGKIDVLTPTAAGDVHFQQNAVEVLAGQWLFFGTGNGLLRYDPTQDQRNMFEPILHISGITVNDSIVSTTGPIELPFGDYDIIISFAGISLRDPEGTTYRYQLEGYDSEWSEPTTTNRARFNHLAPGSYTFRVMAFNADGQGGSEIREVTILIDQPFWQKWWFIAACVILLILIVRFVIHRRERFLKQNQEYLKTELAARTHEVIAQKELLEIRNKDITDSILYARNIQRAMLPAHAAVSSSFPQAFVYFKPRDIVSGDFYWLDEDGDRVIIACADCTGHGVPGAFMSLIGTILLNEISQHHTHPGPGEMLTRLHHELREILRRGSHELQLDDGMDISLVEYDRNSRRLRVASANRPVFLHAGRAWMDIPGDRRSIGGREEHIRSTEFTEHTFYLAPGDCFYLYSDGLTDQFGGPRGKKLKKNGLRQWLEELRPLHMADQRDALKSRFQEWKGSLEQVDDVLIIGIRV